jgi:hypothetical protein
MQKRLSAFLVAAAALFLAPTTSLWTARTAVLQAQAPATAPAAASAKVWVGRHAEFEEFIRTAEVDRIETLTIGVTHPKRAYFKPGGLAESVAWKVLPPGRPAGYWESYKSEIAGYELDKLLGMDMVPPSVEKKWKGDTGAAILWLKPIRDWKTAEKLPKPPTFEREVVRMKMFDNFICNKDRNQGNLLVDDEWNLFLIDHSRAFITDKDLPFKMGRIDKKLWERMLELDEPTLTAAIGKWVERGVVKSILERRDKMKVEIEKLVKATSEPAVFIR